LPSSKIQDRGEVDLAQPAVGSDMSSRSPRRDSNPPTDVSDRLWTPDEVAHFLGLSRKGVYGLAERRLLPSVKVGNRLRFDPADIRRWVSSHRRGPIDDKLAGSQARVSLERGRTQ